ncbi:unnamed protein product [Phytophthora lilii]|uniref:Unnamed protein product n=1 Tax=Phytophthora lilii TaxID=2077276 RepID=A0A9W6WVH7_9STRA|nr:unnamed protein product [Phytophthora lilii]
MEQHYLIPRIWGKLDAATNTRDLGDLDSAIRKSKETGRLRMYRRRIRNERESLQRQEKRLREVLGQLENSRPNRANKSQANTGLSNSVWKVIAAQQLQERRETEAVQRQLKASIKAQDACIEAFQQLYHGHERETTNAYVD